MRWDQVKPIHERTTTTKIGKSRAQQQQQQQQPIHTNKNDWNGENGDKKRKMMIMRSRTHRKPNGFQCLVLNSTTTAPTIEYRIFMYICHRKRGAEKEECPGNHSHCKMYVDRVYNQPDHTE